jgi:hypothetical protein
VRKGFGTNAQYLEHLADDVTPSILRTIFKIANGESFCVMRLPFAKETAR